MAHRRHTVYVIFRALRARNLNASRTDNSLYTIVCVRVCVCVCVSLYVCVRVPVALTAYVQLVSMSCIISSRKLFQ